MKTMLKITGLLLLSSAILTAAECTSEKKAQMIMNGIEQSVIDKMCSPQPAQAQPATQQPIQVIINNSSSAENQNAAPAPTPAPAPSPYAAAPQQDYSTMNSLKRDRLYISAGTGSYTGTHEWSSDEYYSIPVELDVEGESTTFAVGYVFDSNNRFEISSSTIPVEVSLEGYFPSNRTIEGVDLNWQFVLGTKNVQSGNLRPYILFGLGSYSMSYDDEPTSESLNGVAVNLGIGITLPIGDSIELDLGYHLKSIAWEDTTYTTYDYWGNEEETTITQTTVLAGANLAIRLKF